MSFNTTVYLSKPIYTTHSRLEVALPASKSESNRVLIIEALARWQQANALNYTISNYSQARDTQILQELLQTDNLILDVQDAGTVMRFLLAYSTVTHQKVILTGTERMCQRPIGILVEALRHMGASIDYLQNDGYPPVQINDFEQVNQEVQVQSHISSQFISALCMVAPILKNGLKITLESKITSAPYIDMTLALMQHFGVKHTKTSTKIEIAPQVYQLQDYEIEADWSSASYWYSMVALSEGLEVYLPGLKQISYQGDIILATLMVEFGVQTQYLPQGVVLKKNKDFLVNPALTLDFTHCPDLAQTIVALAIGLEMELQLTGLESLRIKETDRIQALIQEVKKFSYSLHSQDQQTWKLQKVASPAQQEVKKINTYNDHRMAMAFAPLALKYPLEIQNPSVVQKSYPNFWQELSKVIE